MNSLFVVVFLQGALPLLDLKNTFKKFLAGLNLQWVNGSDLYQGVDASSTWMCGLLLESSTEILHQSSIQFLEKKLFLFLEKENQAYKKLHFSLHMQMQILAAYNSASQETILNSQITFSNNQWISEISYVLSDCWQREIKASWLKTILEQIPKSERNSPVNYQRFSHRWQAPIWVGIVNATPDSFSDGGLLDNHEKMLLHFQKLIDDGAGVIDIGAESTCPNAQLLSSAEECQRLLPVLILLKNNWSALTKKIIPKISVDTRHAATVNWLLTHFSIDWINDVDGDEASSIAHYLKNTDLHYVSMHRLSMPACLGECLPNTNSPVKYLNIWWQQRRELLLKAGLNPAQLIFDPGIGFGKNSLQTFQFFREYSKLQTWQTPLLLGYSRKSFLQALCALPASKRDVETAALTALIIKNSPEFCRVHDVEMQRRAYAVAEMFENMSSTHDN